MLIKLVENLLQPGKFAKTRYMSVCAVATFKQVRFMLNDFSAGESSEFILNIVQLKNDDDKKGRHIGQPIEIDPAIIKTAISEADSRGLDLAKAQCLIISHVLVYGDVQDKLRKECGSCPSLIKQVFLELNAENEKGELGEYVSELSADVKAHQRGRPRI